MGDDGGAGAERGGVEGVDVRTIGSAAIDERGPGSAGLFDRAEN